MPSLPLEVSSLTPNLVVERIDIEHVRNVAVVVPAESKPLSSPEGQEAIARARLFSASPDILVQLKSAIEAWPEFDTPDDQVNGGDLVGWFANWREEAKALVARAEGRVEHEYLFDVRLTAAIRVKATSQADAVRMIEAIDANTANLGAWPNGDPIVCEVSIFENAGGGDLRAVEIDGVAV